MSAPPSFRWVEGMRGKLAGSAKPYSERQVDWLFKRGIGAMVSLSPLDPQVEERIGQKGLVHLNCLVPDFGAPVPTQLKVFLDFLDKQLAEGSAVLVHCGAGQGRTGTLLASYLIHTGESLSQAILRTGGEPESPEQMQFLQNLAGGDALHS